MMASAIAWAYQGFQKQNIKIKNQSMKELKQHINLYVQEIRNTKNMKYKIPQQFQANIHFIRF